MNWLFSRITNYPQPVNQITPAMHSSSSQPEDIHQSPAKRRRLEQDADSYTQTAQNSISERSESEVTLTDDVRIKKERSPSPQLGAYPRLITSGSKHVYPVPQSCRKGENGYVEARKEWAKREVFKLKRIGIKYEKIFVRDDGMVIDWTSPVPVWSDTLLPPSTSQSKGDASTAINSFNLTSEFSSQETVVSDGDSTSQTLLREVTRGLSQDDPIGVEDKLSTSGHANKGSILDNTKDNLTSPDLYQQQIRPLEELAFEFLRSYVQAFDNDRASLKNAYSNIAQFSYQIHDIISPNSVAAAFLPRSEVERFVSRKNNRNLWNKDLAESTAFEGRKNIVSAVMEFGPHRFSPSGLESIDYDVIYINPPPRIAIISHGYLIDTEHEHRLSFDQIFVLQKRDEEVADRSTPGLWPLVAISHQWTVRDLRSHLSVIAAKNN